jgi:serine/threonine protein kinase
MINSLRVTQDGFAERFETDWIDRDGGFLARDKVTGSTVTLRLFKTYGDRAAEDDRDLLREVLAIGSMSSAHIERVLDAGAVGEYLFVTAEPLDGGSLQELMRKRAWSATEVHIVIGQIAHALARAHREGILHRQLNPASVKLVPANGASRVIVLGFGFAGLQAAILERHPVTFSRVPDLTKFPYAAPEAVTSGAHPVFGPMAFGKRCDTRADLYSLGVIAFEMISGSLPFAETGPGVLLSILKEPPARLAHTDPRFPRMTEIDRFLQRALAKDPADRPPDAVTFFGELEQALFGRSTGTNLPSEDEPFASVWDATIDLT